MPEKTFAAQVRPFWRVEKPAAPECEQRSPFGDLVWSPGVLSRNGVRYLRCRTWRKSSKSADMALLKAIKIELAESRVAQIADDFAVALQDMFGAGFFASVAPVACGHSRRPNCLSVRLAVALSERLAGDFVKPFKDRFVEGVSHPKEFVNLPPLEMVEKPSSPCLVVDDVATSGFHIHEAVTALRAAGVHCFGAVWISGVRQ